MSDTIRFVVTEDHLKLARAMYVGWEDCEFGAPAVNCKRPYGNSDVYGDMAEILGIETSDDEDEPLDEATRADLSLMHEQMQTVLQIALKTASFTAGEYEADKYRQNWKRIP